MAQKDDYLPELEVKEAISDDLPFIRASKLGDMATLNAMAASDPSIIH